MERLMTLDEFVKQHREAVDKFEKHWREKAKTDAAVFPMEMHPGEWDEQLHFFDPYQ